MKNAFILFTFILLTSFTTTNGIKKLPNGHYDVELDKEYLERGANNFDFTLENDKFIMKIAEKYEVLEINWIDENTFIVKGFTEPLNPTELEKKIMGNTKIVFKITKQEGNKYYFTLGEEFDKYPIFSGKIVKTE